MLSISHPPENHQENRTCDFLANGVMCWRFVKTKTMTLTTDDITAIKEAFKPEFEQIDQRFEQVDQRFEQVDQRFEQIGGRIDEMDHKTNIRLTRIELRLDSIEYKIGQIGGFVPFENAYMIPSGKKKKDDQTSHKPH